MVLMRALVVSRWARRATAQAADIFFFLRRRLVSATVFLRLPAAVLRFLSATFGSVESAASVMSPPARSICWAMDGATGAQTAGAKAPPSKRQVSASKPVVGVKTQPCAGSQVSTVHGSVSWQVRAGLEQVPVAASQVPAVWHWAIAGQTARLAAT